MLLFPGCTWASHVIRVMPWKLGSPAALASTGVSTSTTQNRIVTGKARMNPLSRKGVIISPKDLGLSPASIADEIGPWGNGEPIRKKVKLSRIE
jgi:hypothetical protein